MSGQEHSASAPPRAWPEFVTLSRAPLRPVIFPLHLQDSPDGLPSRHTLSLESTIREVYLTLANTPADPV